MRCDEANVWVPEPANPTLTSRLTPHSIGGSSRVSLNLASQLAPGVAGRVGPWPADGVHIRRQSLSTPSSRTAWGELYNEAYNRIDILSSYLRKGAPNRSIK